MNIRLLALGLGLAVLGLGAGSSVFAENIYRWVDQEGNVHYGDRPSGNDSEQVLKLTYNRTNSESLDNRVQAFQESTDARQAAKSEADEAAQQAAADLAAAEEQQQRCDSYRANLSNTRNARRVYRTDDTGERVYLDDAERASALQETEQYIRDNCES